MRFQQIALAIFLFSIVDEICCYKFYQKKIPNGDRVPHPCNVDGTWQGVGHRRGGGGGSRNSFGEDFALNNHVWDATICRKDSDNDGISNGIELGDPDCTWKEGDSNPNYAGISHPGICNPWNSAQCKETNQWLDCGGTEFKCDALNRQDITVQNMTLRLTKTAVPAKETTYMCQIFDVPDNTKDYHIIADQVIVDNSDVIHHILLYGCTSNEPIDAKFYSPYKCGMGAGNKCDQLIGLWSVGLYGTCHNSEMGFLIGKNGYQRIAMEIHWNNPQHTSTYFDSSGMTVFYTPNLRPHNAGVLQIGQLSLTLPPKKDRIVTEAVCPKECLTSLMKGPVNLTNAINHMHYLGKSQYVQQYRNGTLESQLTREPIYNYDSPQLITYDPVKELRPEDELRTTCEFKTNLRNKTTFFGPETADEMCFAFLWFYPKENMPESKCESQKSIPHCRLDGAYAEKNPIVQGCNVRTFYTSTIFGFYYTLLKENCKPFMCLEECMNFILEAKKDPCFQGDVFSLIESGLQHTDVGFHMLALFHSCDAEVERRTRTPVTELESTTPVTEGYSCPTPVGEINASHLNKMSPPALVVSLIACVSVYSLYYHF